MGFFDWSAPVFKRFLDNRWTTRDIGTFSTLLRPAVEPGGSVLDLGGGTGGLAVRLAGALGTRVTILDPTPAMLDRVPAHPALTVRLGVAEAIPFPDGTFDAVVVSDAMHHFRDLEIAASEMARVTRSGGGYSSWRSTLVAGGEPSWRSSGWWASRPASSRARPSAPSWPLRGWKAPVWTTTR
ncbi:MAG: class I SAM-dependent methyltransferase [Thermoleophilia bacterium]|nr:class I SAM-dependent methyltransferase [Thermoleophilia bacterium]